MCLVQCVHWLRAQAQLNRWKEETTLVGYEMEWTVRYFLYQSELWKGRAFDCPDTNGAMAYASRQSAIWYCRACSAEKDFKFSNHNYVKLIQ